MKKSESMSGKIVKKKIENSEEKFSCEREYCRQVNMA